MLYMSPVVSQNSTEIDMYENFILFSVAMHLLLSSGTSEVIIDCAHGLLVSFVWHLGQLYGTLEMVYNIHQLTHLAEEYHLFGLWIMCQQFFLRII